MITMAESLRLTVRQVEESDIETLAVALGPETSAAQVRRRFEESRGGFREMLVAELSGSVVGTVSMGGHRFQRTGSLRLFALDVGAAFRNRGVGTALVRSVEIKAAEQVLDEVNLEVAVENEDAIRLYERLGYRHVGEPVMDSWERLRDDGSSELVEMQSWVMVKALE